MKAPVLARQEPTQAAAAIAVEGLEAAPAAEIAGPIGYRSDVLSRCLSWLGERVILFRAGDWVFVNFGLLSGLGAFLALVWMAALTVGQGLAPGLFPVLALGGSVGIVAGSWLVAQVFDYRMLLDDPVAALRRPTFISWGGLLALPLVVAPFARYAEFDALLLLDALARATPLGQALGRVGCLTYGCCYGRPTEHSPAITYRHPLAKAVRVGGLRGVPLHPAALYEAVLLLGVFALANASAVLDAPVGVPSALALLLYGAGRLAIEFTRDNEGRFLFGRVAVNHAVSLATAGIGALLLYVVLANPQAALPFVGSAALQALDLLPILACAGAVVFVGFAAHRGDVGRW